MKMRENYTCTIYASMVGYITQAIVNNFAPLLFLTFQSSYHLSLDKIAFLVTMNFGVQLLTDFLSARFVDRIGYRISIVAAHIFSAAGLVGLAWFPTVAPTPYTGLLAAIFLYAIGGGLIEVLISPIVEACPTNRKEAYMSLLHSFYCWGHVAVVLVSTLFFTLLGTAHWQILACLWALIPLLNGIWFMIVPIRSLTEEGEGEPVRSLLKRQIFWIFVVLMICAGASEQAVSQWASAFAESGLHVTKTVGDLAGPCMFAFLMGSSRLLYARYSEKMKLPAVMAVCSVFCMVGYLLISLSSSPFVGLAGCGLCGFSVGVMWPGTFSLAAKHMRGGGTAMFAIFALAGDVGCSLGPAYVGIVSGAFQDNLKTGFLAALIFPVLLLVGLRFLKRKLVLLPKQSGL